MRIVHVCAGAEANNGAAVIAAGFARAQAKGGHEVIFVATSLSRGAAEVDLTGCRRAVFPRCRLPVLRELCFSWRLARELRGICRGADAVVTHCQWTFPVWWGAFCAPRRLVMVPEGSFDPVRLRHSAWKKRLAGFLDRLALRRADELVALSPREADWIRAYARGTDPARVVLRRPVVELPPEESGGRTAGGGTPRAAGTALRVLYLGRRHPLKGIDLLEEAVRGLPVELRVEDSIFGEARESAFRWCDVLCLPTRSENFGMVVAEALARSRPVVTTTAAPWEGLAAHRCGWWVAPEAPALRSAIVEAVRLRTESPDELAAMGRRGRAWVAEEFGPDRDERGFVL